MSDPCIGCINSPKRGALECTGGFDVFLRDDPATSGGWADPIKAETEGHCPLCIEEVRVVGKS